MEDDFRFMCTTLPTMLVLLETLFETDSVFGTLDADIDRAKMNQ
jgi:hypothetical protein